MSGSELIKTIVREIGLAPRDARPSLLDSKMYRYLCDDEDAPLGLEFNSELVTELREAGVCVFQTAGARA